MQIHPIPKPPPGLEPALPKEPLCYVAGANGLFKVVRNAFYTACVKLDGITALAALKEEAGLNVPLLPLEQFRRVEAFFAAVFETHRSEAVVLLYCNPRTEDWQVVVPAQAVRGLHVEYDLKTLPAPAAGYELFGTIHSHADVKAFHSGTDDADEACFDGLHITIGNLDQPVRSYACRWILGGRVFKADLEDVVAAGALPSPDPQWLAQVQPAPQREPEDSGSTGLGQGGVQKGLWGDAFGESFASREEYLEYLESMRNEIDERLWEAEDLEPAKGQGEAHAAKH